MGFKNKNILITGGLGFIGSNLAIKLVELGANVTIIDSMIPEYGGNIKNIEPIINKIKIKLSKNKNNHLYLFSQRFIDIVLSIIGLVIFISLLPLFLIGNLLGNRGSLFYTQKRVGYKGKIFKIYKLRSMVKNAEKNGPVWAIKNDQRITPFGKILRIFRLDELPQMINVIKGEMSIIGPRPERPEFVKQLKSKIPFYSMRHVVRPGLTGWAQVNYPYANTIEEQQIKLRYDLYYIKERSTFLDFKILVKTISTVLFFKGQ